MKDVGIKYVSGMSCERCRYQICFWNVLCPYSIIKVKGKAILLQSWIGPKHSRRLRLPDFKEDRHMKVVRLSALLTGHLCPKETFPVLISVRG